MTEPPAPRSMNWVCGVTTVPDRRNDYLPHTMRSLVSAGFRVDRLFVDGAKDGTWWEREHRVPVTCRWPHAGIYASWILGLWELYLRNPDAERYAMFQDDVLLCRNTRLYLDQQPWPKGDTGKSYLNLMTLDPNDMLLTGHIKRGNRWVKENDGKPIGWHEDCLLDGPKRQQQGRGATALAFSREGVMALISCPHMSLRMHNQDRRNRFVDGAVVEAMNGMGWRSLVHNPSLAFHIGVKSTKNSSYRPVATFPGEDFDALKMLEK